MYGMQVCVCVWVRADVCAPMCLPAPQSRAVQGMLDFDFICGRTTQSVAAMVFPFSGNHFVKFYWGDKEIMMPVYSSTGAACAFVLSFLSFTSEFQPRH